MAEIRSRSSRQIWITRGHLAALGVTTFFIAVLAFLVGLQIGKKTQQSEAVASTSSSGPAPLVPDAIEEEKLEALLREVEYAQATLAPTGELVTEPTELEFPEALAEDVSTLGTDMPSTAETRTTVKPSPDHQVEEPPAPPPETETEHAPPTSGWAVQVAAFPYANEADAKIKRLQEKGLSAYRVAALLDGKTWYRVRIGGYATEEEAVIARNELRVRLGQRELLIASAP